MDCTSQKDLKVGARWHGALPKTYWDHFNLLEIPLDQAETLKRATIARWLGESSDERTLAVPIAANLQERTLSAETISAVTKTASIAEDGWILLHTPSDFRPTQRNRQRLRDALARLSDVGLQVAWWSDGLWDYDERIDAVKTSGCSLVVDPLDDELDELDVHPSYYFRVRGRRGFQNQLSDHDLFTIHRRVSELGRHISFGLSGFWSDALRFNLSRSEQDNFWS